MPTLTKSSTHRMFHVTKMHPAWSAFMSRTGLDATELVGTFGVSRERMVAWIKREPTKLHRLAMSAIYHRLPDYRA